MSAATAIPGAPARPAPTPVHVHYRDDGPLARALAGALGRLRVPAIVSAVLGVLPLVATIALEGRDAPHAAVAAVLAWLIVAGAAAAGRPERGRLRWLLPGILRLAEYTGLLWIATLAGPSSEPAAFALLAAIAFRHYDIVYRLRHRGATPPRWVGLLGPGWDGRLVIAFVLLVAGALPAGYFAWAAVLGVAFVAESVSGWVRAVQRPVEYEDEEDEGQ